MRWGTGEDDGTGTTCNGKELNLYYECYWNCWQYVGDKSDCAEFLQNKALKVPKCEILDSLESLDFYTTILFGKAT
jgi:hypothetical protein